MVALRLLGAALMVVGLGFVGPLARRGPAMRLSAGARSDSRLLAAFVVFRVWFVRLIGACLIVGGAIYLMRPPNRLY
ncbi:MAG: hypothetical protein ACJ760_07605 [Thermoleophilaceae bacterium]